MTEQFQVRVNDHVTPPPGFHGRYLRIDLGRRVADWIEIPASSLRDFFGGTGLGVYLMMREAQAGVDPLTEDACLAFVFSPLVGSPLTTSAKFAVVCKSPLTHRYNDALASSGFAIAGKAVGADAIVIRGRASSPSVLVIDDGRVQLRDARHLWGETMPATEQRLQQELGRGFQSAVIGPAGERQIAFATISHNGRHAGRGGSGAVLGAKRIKAVALRGSQRCAFAQPQQLHHYAKQLSKRSLGEATAKYRHLGTASNLLAFNRLNALPTRNFQQGSFEHAEQISPESLVESRNKTRKSCVACTIGCEHLYEIKKPSEQSSAETESAPVRLEYENLFALGSLCGVSEPDQVLRASRLCDELGLDTISTGGTIAFAMECAEEGWLDAPDLQFGSGESLLRTIQSIADQDRLGRMLGRGSRWLGSQLGAEAAARAPHVKGLELPGYDPRAVQALAIGFAVGARGADHNRSGAYEADFSTAVDRKAADVRSVSAAIQTENQAAIIDSLILCKFLRKAFDDLFAEAAKMIQMVCGWDLSKSEVEETAERIVAAKKLFNIHAGWQPQEDRLPERIMNTPLPDDPESFLDAQNFKTLVRAYNVQRRWTPDGWIPPQELTRLGLAPLTRFQATQPTN